MASRRNFPDQFYEERFGNTVKLKELWYQRYIEAHPSEFGITDLEGPFDTGPDFNGLMDGYFVSIEVEREYLTFLQHGHDICDVLIVGVEEEPTPKMRKYLPREILYLDPQRVLDWSRPQRLAYWELIQERKVNNEKLMEFISENQDIIAAANQTEDERILIRFKLNEPCRGRPVPNAKGHWVKPIYINQSKGIVIKPEVEDFRSSCEGTAWEVQPDYSTMTDGQMADVMAGLSNWKVLECDLCGDRYHVESPDRYISLDIE